MRIKSPGRRVGETAFSTALQLASLAAMVACGSSTADGPATSGQQAGSGAQAGVGGSTGTFVGAGGSGAGSSGPGSVGAGGMDTCAQQEAEATLVKAPVDILFVIDNSGSMTNEIQGVEKNINESFAKIIEASGIDYRVILIARHGSASGNQSVCLEAPLSGIPQGDCTPPPSEPVNNPPKFFHYSTEIGSTNPLCKTLESYAKADEHNLAPMGYQEWLRPEAIKFFVVVTDDRANCSFGGVLYDDKNTVVGGQATADKFDAALLALSPEQFGTAMERRYRWYSIDGIQEKDLQMPEVPWQPADMITTAKCSSAVNGGTGYQALSVKTEALRFPLCQLAHYDSMFNEIANGVVQGASVSCEFPLPAPPPGEELNLETIVVKYMPGMGAPVNFALVASLAECGPEKFYLDGELIKLCPDACKTVQADSAAKISVLFGCIGTAG